MLSPIPYPSPSNSASFTSSSSHSPLFPDLHRIGLGRIQSAGSTLQGTECVLRVRRDRSMLRRTRVQSPKGTPMGPTIRHVSILVDSCVVAKGEKHRRDEIRVVRSARWEMREINPYPYVFCKRLMRFKAWNIVLTKVLI